MSALEELCNRARLKGQDPQEMRESVLSSAAVLNCDVEGMASELLEVMKVYDAIEAKREERNNEMAKRLGSKLKTASTPKPMTKGMPMKGTPGGKSTKGTAKGAHSMKGSPSAHTPGAMPGC